MVEKKEQNKSERILIDGTGAILGRLASYVAKQALLGKEIVIVNSEKAIIIGKKERIIEKYIQRRKRRGPGQRGPIFPSLPERILKRAIRGMLKHKKGFGKKSFKRTKCYKGVPKEYEKDKKIIAGKEKNKNYLTLEELSRHLK